MTKHRSTLTSHDSQAAHDFKGLRVQILKRFQGFLRGFRNINKPDEISRVFRMSCGEMIDYHTISHQRQAF
jgi:hypothetical protein